MLDPRFGALPARRTFVDLTIPKAFEFLFESSRYKAAYGGRDSTKSTSFARALLTRAFDRPLRILCCREIQSSIRDSVKRVLDDTIERNGLGVFWDSTDNEIKGANGSLFLFAGLRHNVETIKSKEGIDIAWLAEANRISQESLDILLPTIRKPGSEIWCEWNPEFPTDPVDVMFRGVGGPPPNAIVKQVSWRINRWLSEETLADMDWMRKRDPDKFAHIYEGEYQRHSEARVFRNWRVGEDEEFQTKADTIFRFGADWGFANDPTTLVRCYIDGRKLCVDHEAHQVGCEIDKTPALFDTVPGSRVWPIRADSARPETISYMRRNGFPHIVKAYKGDGSVKHGVELLKSYDIIVHRRCVHVIDELTHYSYKVDRQVIDPETNQPKVLPVLEDKKNHCIDPLRYALEEVAAFEPWALTG